MPIVVIILLAMDFAMHISKIWSYAHTNFGPFQKFKVLQSPLQVAVLELNLRSTYVWDLESCPYEIRVFQFVEISWSPLEVFWNSEKLWVGVIEKLTSLVHFTSLPFIRKLRTIRNKQSKKGIKKECSKIKFYILKVRKPKLLSAWKFP